MIQVSPTPLRVAELHAFIAIDDPGDMGAVVLGLDVMHSTLTLLDAVTGSVSDFAGFCEQVVATLEELAPLLGHPSSPPMATMCCLPEWFDRMAAHARLPYPGFTAPETLWVDVERIDLRRLEDNPVRRARGIAAAPMGSVAIAERMAKKLLRHPFDVLSSMKFDPADPPPLVDALGLAYDVLMVSPADRRRVWRAEGRARGAAHQR